MTPGLPLGWRFRAAAAALVIPPLLYVLPLPRLIGWIEGRRGAGSRPRAGVDDRVLARWVDRLLRRLPGPWRRTCLKRAGVLYYLLRRAGRPVELCIGVRRPTDAPLSAHAWLQRDGAPYLESDPDGTHAHTLIAHFSHPADRAS